MNTIAGSPNNVHFGGATTSTTGMMEAVISDGSGGLLVVAWDQNRVYRISAQGEYSLFAGNGIPVEAGDGGAATSASLWEPLSLARDSAGNVYVGDVLAIRKIAPDGTISTLTNAIIYPMAMALSPSGQLYVALEEDVATGAVYSVESVDTSSGIATVVAGNGEGACSTPSGDGCNATDALFGYPLNIALSGNTLYVGDSAAAEIHAVDLTTGMMRQFAGSYDQFGFSGDGGQATAAKLEGPQSLAVDSAGDLLFWDNGNQRIRSVNSAGVISTVAGNGALGGSGDGGAPTSATIGFAPYQGILPTGVNQFIFADTDSGHIRQVQGGKITTIAGAGADNYNGDGELSTLAGLGHSADVLTDSTGNLYISDTFNGRIRKVDARTGLISTIAGTSLTPVSTGDGGPATAATLWPAKMTFGPSGNLYFVDGAAGTADGRPSVRMINATTGIISTVVNELYDPSGIAVASNGDLYVADAALCTVTRFTAAGESSVVVNTAQECGLNSSTVAAEAELNYPLGIALDGSGNLYIADADNYAIKQVNLAAGTISTFAGGTYGAFPFFREPSGIRVAGNILYGVDESNRDVFEISLPDGDVGLVAGNEAHGYSTGTQSGSTPFGSLVGVAADGYGNVYVADIGNNVVDKISAVPASSPLQLTASATHVPANGKVTLTATVPLPYFGKNPTGKVSFYATGNLLGTVGLTNGVATVTGSANGVPLGEYYVVATYSGDSNYAATPSNTVPVYVQANTTTALTIGTNPVKAGAPEQITVQVARQGFSGTATGNVQLVADGAVLATLPLSSGKATLNLGAVNYPKNTYSVQAVYQGDTTDAASSSSVVSVTVD